jgi:hypothetical protein
MIPSQAARWPESSSRYTSNPVLKFTRSISGANGWRESGLRPKAERLDFPYCEHY